MTLMKELHTIFPMHINKSNFFCKVHEDNQSTIIMAKSDKFTLQTKHIALKYHHFCSHVKNRHIDISYCPTEDQKADLPFKTFSRCSIFQTKTYAHWLVIRLWHRSSVTRECGISLLLDSHLANCQQFLLKVCQMRFPRNSVCSRNSRKIPFARDSDSTPNLPGIPPCVWCTTEWHHTNSKQKSHSLVWMTQSHAMSNFRLFSARCLRDNAMTSMPSASLFS
jgi:hypothetical protein